MTRLYIPLYDTANGGPPLGFRCAFTPHNPTGRECAAPRCPCRRVLRTERGMLAHLWAVHKIKRQEELWKK